MREYHVLRHKKAGSNNMPDRDLVLVPERFSWPAFLFGPFWFLWHRTWPLAVATGAAWALALLLPPVQASVISLLLSLLVGLEGNTWRRWYLLRRDYDEIGIILAHDADEALALALAQVNGQHGTTNKAEQAA